tara:strand:- start:32 stop:250 length:219 start_codon:yes stop_codon:yes gene_type:complete
MGCKNCKGKELSGMNKILQKKFEDAGKNILEHGVDKTVGRVTFSEKIILLFLAWIPLLIGYFTIIKFIVSLF